MKNSTILLFIISVILIGFGCKPETTQEGVMPTSSGKPGSILVVADSAKFNREVGLSIKKTLSKVHKGLPQPEPLFELTQIHPTAFKKIFHKHRNILKIEVDPKYTQARILVRKNVYAKPQIMLHVQAPNDSSMVGIFSKKGDVIAQKYLEAERQRYIASYKKISNNGAEMRLREKFGIKVIIPKGYSLDMDTTNFAWIENEGRHYTQGLLIYEFPYKGDHVLTRGYLIKMRDKFTKQFVPGPSPNSYMINEDQIIPFHEVRKINDHDVVFMQGLWEVKNDFMGGPYISASIVDEERQKVITVDGYVYAPRFDKRNYVRQLEAILYTLDLAN